MSKTPRGRWLKDPRTLITRPFGVPGPYAAGYHTGVDLAVPGAARIPVVWALKRPGRVTRVGTDPLYGRYVIVRSSAGNEYLFAHLDQVNVSARMALKSGALIGRTGSTGNVTGDHLHLEKGKGQWRYGNVVRPPVYDY